MHENFDGADESMAAVILAMVAVLISIALLVLMSHLNRLFVMLLDQNLNNKMKRHEKKEIKSIYCHELYFWRNDGMKWSGKEMTCNNALVHAMHWTERNRETDR